MISDTVSDTMVAPIVTTTGSNPRAPARVTIGRPTIWNSDAACDCRCAR
jgi:hypothetical protein